VTPKVTSTEMTSQEQTGPEATLSEVSVSPRDVVKLRRAAAVAACLGAISFMVLVPAGYPLAGAFFCGGLGLGLCNAALVQRSATRFAASDVPTKRQFAVSALARLALITALAVGLALAVRPEGLAVFAGLAACQLLMIFMTSIPLVKELRQSRVGVSHDN
jgi:hypothetical protein